MRKALLCGEVKLISDKRIVAFVTLTYAKRLDRPEGGIRVHSCWQVLSCRRLALLQSEDMKNDIATVLNHTECKDALAMIDGHGQAMIQTVIKWSHINSGSRNLEGLARMEQEVVDAFACLSPKVELVPLPDTESVSEDGQVIKSKNSHMVRFSKRPEAKRKLLMTGHLDTVFATDSPFQETKWLDDNTLNGPGVADMKGGILVMLHALMALEQTSFAEDVGWEVCLSPDEETGSLASAPILVERAKLAHMGMTYEPALPDGTLAGARKGSGNFTLTVKGLAAHAGRDFFKGVNAIVVLADLMQSLAALTGGREGLTVNVAKISGGVAPNVVPDLAICRFNVRLSEMADADWLMDQLNGLVSQASAKEGITVSLHGGINRPPKEITPANQLMMDLISECGAALGIGVSYQATGGCCEGNNLAAAGLPNVDTLGVVGGLIHSADEFALVDSFTERAKLSALIMMAFSIGHFDNVIKSK